MKRNVQAPKYFEAAAGLAAQQGYRNDAVLANECLADHGIAHID